MITVLHCSYFQSTTLLFRNAKVHCILSPLFCIISSAIDLLHVTQRYCSVVIQKCAFGLVVNGVHIIYTVYPGYNTYLNNTCHLTQILYSRSLSLCYTVI